jgi:hypothetical protein
MFSKLLLQFLSPSSYDIYIFFRTNNLDHNIFMATVLETETLYLEYSKISLSDWHSCLSNHILPAHRFLNWNYFVLPYRNLI